MRIASGVVLVFVASLAGCATPSVGSYYSAPVEAAEGDCDSRKSSCDSRCADRFNWGRDCEVGDHFEECRAGKEERERICREDCDNKLLTCTRSEGSQ